MTVLGAIDLNQLFTPAANPTVTPNCANPANASNPVCATPATSTGSLIPTWVWIIGIGLIGFAIYKHKTKTA